MAVLKEQIIAASRGIMGKGNEELREQRARDIETEML